MVRLTVLCCWLLGSVSANAQEFDLQMVDEDEELEIEWEEMEYIPYVPDDGAQPVWNGYEASKGQFPSVVNLGGVSGGYFTVFCSGTVIADTWVLTAAHCLDAVEDGSMDGYGLRVFFGHDIIGTGPEAQIAWEAYQKHPSWTGKIENGADIGLIQMKTKRTGLTPMVVNDENVNNSWNDSQVVFVGFGITREGRTDSGVKRYTNIPFYD